MMKHTILSALLTSGRAFGSNCGRLCHDLTGGAVADAHVSLLNPDTSVKQEAVTGTTAIHSGQRERRAVHFAD